MVDKGSYTSIKREAEVEARTIMNMHAIKIYSLHLCRGALVGHGLIAAAAITRQKRGVIERERTAFHSDI